MKFPIVIHSLEKKVEGNVHVDKTDLIYKLVTERHILIKLLRMAMGCEAVEPVKLAAKEWIAVYRQACSQSLSGMIYGVVNRMGGDENMPRPLLFEWICKAESIVGLNTKMNAEAARLTEWFDKRGRMTAILKGQANARLYPHPDERQPGDIDIWVEGGKDSVVKLLTEEGMMDKKATVSYHHVHLPPNNDGISVEVHFRPSSGNNNPFTNRRLQHILENEIKHSEFCPEGFYTPTMRFALLMQMSHIQRHFLSGGIGLRHIVDYFMLMRSSSSADRAFAREHLSECGLDKTAGAVMWLMEELFDMKRDTMIAEPDAYRGRWMLDEILEGGNFGHHSKRRKQGFWHRIFEDQKRNIRLMRFYFWEEFFSVLLFWWHVFKTIPKRIRYRTLSLSRIKEE